MSGINAIAYSLIIPKQRKNRYMIGKTFHNIRKINLKKIENVSSRNCKRNK